ncbi:hypothetical protein R3P38DRAFT_3213731 [Favolaschia claudopus]|uniref:Plasma membrane fusion protein PRM1 n=1 Tax=Favolaschia claudopus TaxID=2862362 RepID=A0AAW0AE42_9AGAR
MDDATPPTFDAVENGDVSDTTAIVASTATNLVETTANSIATAIQQSFSAATSALQSAVSAANKFPGVNIPLPAISAPDLSSLQSLSLPTTFEDQLHKLQSQLPQLDELRQIVDNFIDVPFNKMKADINTTFGSLMTRGETFPIPAVALPMTFCQKLDTSVIDNLSQGLTNFAMWGSVSLGMMAVFTVLINCTWLWYRSRYLNEHLHEAVGRWVITGGDVSHRDILSLNAEISHPILAFISRSWRLRPPLEWLLYYVFLPAPFACLTIGVCGLVGVQTLIWALERVHADYSTKVTASVSAMAGAISVSMNDTFNTQSASYAAALNHQISTINTSMHNGTLEWLDTTISALNETLFNAYTNIQSAITTVFGGTALNDPVQNFLQCLLGSKVDDLDKALSFLQNALNMSIAPVVVSPLSLPESALEEITQTIAEAAVVASSIDGAGLVGALVNEFKAFLVSPLKCFLFIKKKERCH